jgi:hypothetical protein
MWLILPSKINFMDRESGFYWVKFENEPWEVAKWDSKIQRWYLTEADDVFKDFEFERVDENQIKKYKR